MKSLTISLAVSPLLLLLLALPSQAATLQWRFASGDIENYRFTQSARLSESSEKAAKQIAEVEQELDLTWKVLEVDDDGNARISLSVSAFSFLAKGPDGQEVRYDSESTEEPQGYAAMLLPIGKRLAEAAVEFTMSPSGAVTDMKLPDDLAEAVKSIPSGKKFAQDGGLKSFEVLARLGAPISFPVGEVSADQEWSESREVELPVLGNLNSEYVYKLVGEVTDKEATIEQRMRINPPADDNTARFINQESSGTIVFSVDAGRPETSTFSYQAELQTTEATEPTKLVYSVEFRRMVDETQ
jgi:hypothetical protein